MSTQFKAKNNPRVIAIQKIYGKFYNKDEDLSLGQHRFKKFIKDIVNGTIERNDLIALTDKTSSNEVFSFGRDHGHFGRILNQTVVSVPSLNFRNGNEINGFCFTPQDGNSLLSSIAIAEWFLYPHSYVDKIQCLSPFLFDEV